MKPHFLIALLNTKKTLLVTSFCVLLLIYPSSLFASGWQVQESNTNANLRGVWFADSLNGWVCGEAGTILHTSTGGEVWETQESGVTVDLEDVFFWDMSNGWVVGDSGTILHSSDMGENWTIQNAPVDTYLHTVQFISAERGFVHGNQATYLSTVDGGKTWVGQSGDTTTSNFNSFFWLDEYRGASCHDEYEVAYTIDGGAIWGNAVVSLVPYDICGYRDTISDPYCPKDLYWVVGERGMTTGIKIFECNILIWGSFSGITSDTLNLKAITLENKDAFRLWSVGELGWIIFSEDSGKTWMTSQSSTNKDLYEISFPAEGYGWAVGDSGIILYYRDPPDGIKDEKQLVNFSPAMFELLSPYPNPFNNSTVIDYKLSKPAKVLLKLYDVTGQPVVTLVDTWQKGGEYRTQWQGMDFKGLEVTSGIYIIRLQVDGFQEIKKVAFLK
ncbi:MAG: T9SS type A sorting domain-containing protein [Melioribacteraceae bacterium]|nr:T9SS type A sorting domain-containing protein [Melioribacteraceae bacterium]MCF8355091.1 T9SS type A sorting domain-containing protein [Melioribacteraceae bacterium]MCF8395059.1 T9SS type A sorting domain-containing protein [Melioribacteraceae bacterium]MCF8420309.1 T9SS type A sorting domain-containing protein [Melioribacteraceae bacterium]